MVSKKSSKKRVRKAKVQTARTIKNSTRSGGLTKGQIAGHHHAQNIMITHNHKQTVEQGRRKKNG